MGSTFKTNKRIEDSVKTNYIKAQEDAVFKKLINSLDIEEREKMVNTSKFKDTVECLKNCQKCQGLMNCKNADKGYIYYPEIYNNHIEFYLKPCKYKKEELDKIKNKETREKELDKASMKDLDINDKSRVKVIKWITKFINTYDNTKKNKGLYLHGSFGSGKTYIISAVFNELKKKNYRSEIVYFSSLLRDLKGNFDELDSTITYLENIDLLLIDDIGAEKVTEWSRDEILGTILQNRMNNYKTTFFTSNYNIDELENHLASDGNKVASARVIERIKVLTDDIELNGENRRK